MNSRRLRVLLIEDNPGDARLIQESLAVAAEQPFELEIVDTLAMGLERLNAGGVDAIRREVHPEAGARGDRNKQQNHRRHQTVAVRGNGIVFNRKYAKKLLGHPSSV